MHRVLTSIPMMIAVMSVHPDGIAVYSGGLEIAESQGYEPPGARMCDRLAAERRFVVVGHTVTGRDSNTGDVSGLYPGVSAWMGGLFDNVFIRWVADRYDRPMYWYLSLIADCRLST